jgi:hypothetical protein
MLGAPAVLRYRLVSRDVDRALCDDERAIVGTRDALPGRLGASRREPREAHVLDLVAGDGAGVVAVHKERVASRVLGPRAREPRVTQGLPAKASRMEVRARLGDTRGSERFLRRWRVSPGPRRSRHVVGRRPRGAEPLP